MLRLGKEASSSRLGRTKWPKLLIGLLQKLNFSVG